MRGGSGKTTLSLGMAAAWRAMGRKVIPFKKGPDYIDPGWLTKAAGLPCRNLDLFFMNPKELVSYFIRNSDPDGISLVEGNRGLLDGIDSEGSASTAQVAIALDAPVVLILDCTMATRSVAAQVAGIKVLEPEVNLSGVVLNRVAGKRHAKIIRSTIESYLAIPVLGEVPRLAEDRFPERHMGLTPHHEHPAVSEALEFAENLARDHLDLDALWRLGQEAPRLQAPVLEEPGPLPRPGSRLTIGVVRDSAFQFYYPDNIEALEAGGARVVIINGLEDRSLPPLDGLYIGGGFPETHARQLTDNESLRKEIASAAKEGLPIYGECGGLMYLGRSLSVGGKSYPMVGALPISFDIRPRPQGHGYTIARVVGKNPFFPERAEFRGHEFHYSKVVSLDTSESSLVFMMQRGSGISDKRDGLLKGNVMGTYTHVLAPAVRLWARGVVRAALGEPPENAG